ncbi:uncharacterized protein LOC118736188 [Rhagoletis pomonella]|uniref:uncharacterized protein LOC118736188 n=1 Tax=Rhagoletis pomonella TaxID=28610 RepID=UPI0017865548|nr:uncharacterized protein LOC118736188 [Rhagoletis pomonella]
MNEVQIIFYKKKNGIEIQYLRNFFKNKIFSIKTDSAQRLYRSVVCVNAQLLGEGKITVKTLVVKNFKEQHTADNLKQLILEALERYEINIEQIYSITSDNGRNMVKCGSLLQVDNENEESTNILDFDSDDDEGDHIDCNVRYHF